MVTFSYKVGEIKAFLKESNEFKKVVGPNVDSENKRNNEKSYKDTEKRIKDYDGGLQEPKKPKLPPKTDGNRTTLDYNPSIKPDDKYSKNVKAQAQGYTSDLQKKNGIERGGVEMDDEGRIMKNLTDARDEHEEAKKKLQKSGLAARTYPDKVFDVNHLDEGAKPKAKRLIFKHSHFVNESQVYARIPEDYKRDGQRIHVNDADGNEYIVECVKSEGSGNIETHIVSHTNKRQMNEQVNRIFELMSYSESSTSGKASVQEKLNENSEFNKIMDITRGNKK